MVNASKNMKFLEKLDLGRELALKLNVNNVNTECVIEAASM